MQNPNPKEFIFNEKLNGPFLNELFDGDCTYAEAVFGEFLNDLPPYWQEVETAWQQQQTASLGAAVHKCKTLFGYVGLSHIQQFCQELENHCSQSTTIAALQNQYALLYEMKEEAREIIESELKRLQIFNAQS